MRNILIGIGIFVLVAVITVTTVVVLRSDDDYSLHTLDEEVKVVNYLSGGEGHIDIYVDGPGGVLIIRELSAKTATVHIDGGEVLVIVKKTEAQVEFNANNTERHFLLSNSGRRMNEYACERFAQNTSLKISGKEYEEAMAALE